MNEKEIAELRRRLRPEKSAITRIHGCYVNESREIISMFDQSLALMEAEEAEKFLTIFRRTLSGTLGKTLVDISFRTSQVAGSEEHGMLMSLRSSHLSDADAVETFFHRVIDNLTFDGNYVILLACDSYDVPFRGKDGADLEDASETVFDYVVCAVCPVRMSKPALRYDSDQREFHKRSVDWIVSAPELGFVFPAFDDRASNIYGALYYSHSAADNHAEFIDGIFRTTPPMPADEQKQTFRAMLSTALDGGHSLQQVKDVHAQLSGIIADHKANKVTEPLTLSKREVRAVLESCGVSETGQAKFAVGYDEAFGADAELSPRNLVDLKKLEVRTPDVVIQLNPERGDLIESRTIDGVKYLLIHTDGGVEVNGVSVDLSDS